MWRNKNGGTSKSEMIEAKAGNIGQRVPYDCPNNTTAAMLRERGLKHLVISKRIHHRFATTFDRSIVPHTRKYLATIMIPFYFDDDESKAAAVLRYKGVTHLRNIGRRCPPRELRDICDEFRSILANHCWRKKSDRTTAPTCFDDGSLVKLDRALKDDFNDESAFDKALFEALRGCLTIFEVHDCGENNIVLQSPGRNDDDDDDKYAVGFVRQVRPALFDVHSSAKESGASSSPSSTTISSSSGVDNNNRQVDHAVCIFEKTSSSGQKWNVRECFGVVALNMSDTSCEEFYVPDDAIASVDLESSHGALSLTILYAMRNIVLAQARNGICQPSIPLAVIAGRKKRHVCKRRPTDKAPKLPERLRWVSARLYIPEACGNRFTYSMDDFGHFYEKRKAAEKNSAIQAVRVNLDTLLFALKIAIGIRDELNVGRIPLPVPASGRIVKIGKKKLDDVLSFCASPITGARNIPNSTGNKWRINQADLFRGNVNVCGILDQTKISCVQFWNETDTMGAAQVLVKVSSKAVHDLLTNPILAFSALQAVKRGQPKLAEGVGSVLYAAFQVGAGMVTIMADLSYQGYTALTPNMAYGSYLPVLWAGFRDLVETVLLPMADLNIIHPDIRPGYDVTFNILCRLDDDDASKKATLKLIDYETLVYVDKWDVPLLNGQADARFVPMVGDAGECDATTFVW